MASPVCTLAPPLNTGMEVLDRSRFRQKLPLVVAEIADPRHLSKIVKQAAKSDLLDMAKVPTIVVLEGDRARDGARDGARSRGVLLAPRITDPARAPEQLQAGTLRLLRDAGARFGAWELELGYEHWTADEVLRAVLPPELGDPPSGFALVGHIAHINLHAQFLPWKRLIGEVILDKNRPAVRTVVNKLDNIHTVFRTFDMEVIAGEPEFTVTQHESGCRFEFDFRAVYWNSRLHTEHDRLVTLFGAGSAVCDPMAGVGPFAIPAAKRGNVVFANDLNPSSYAALNHNRELNRVNPVVLQTYNEDGREFIRRSVARLHALRSAHKNEDVPVLAAKRRSERPRGAPETAPAASPATTHQGGRTVRVPETFSHYVMNLPATAIEFLDAFRGLYAGARFAAADPPLPMVHVHCFHKWDAGQAEPGRREVQAALAARVSRALGHALAPEALGVHDVRRVAPTKDMYAVSFRLPREVAYMHI